LARQQACTGGQGAALVTEPGPVEVYRMQCDNGKVFMARCEMRQCRPM
jgi:translation initiation factor IF-1